MKCNRTQEECHAPAICGQGGCMRETVVVNPFQPGSLPNIYKPEVQRSPAPVSDRLQEAANKVRDRLKRLAEIEASYTAYLHDRISERDHHGGWDCCVNLSEVSCERDGLLFALEAMGMDP